MHLHQKFQISNAFGVKETAKIQLLSFALKNFLNIKTTDPGRDGRLQLKL